MDIDELYEQKERLADDVREYVTEHADALMGPTTSGYVELGEEVYLDPPQGRLVDAGSVEVEADGATEEDAVAYLQEHGAAGERSLRAHLRDEMYMDLDIDRALSALAEKDNVEYTGDRYRLDTRPEPASDDQVLGLLDGDGTGELREDVLEP